MNIKAFTGGLLDSNVYVAWDNKEAMIIDCGVSIDLVRNFIEENGLSVKYIVLTHGHYDHCEYAKDYSLAYPLAKIVCHENELMVLSDPNANVSALISSKASKSYNFDYTTVKEGDALSIGDSSLEILNLPGHTPGCICLFEKESKTLFTGDVLFASGFGRTDFLFGSFDDMKSSLRRLSTLDGDIKIYPGHGPSAYLKNIFRH